MTLPENPGTPRRRRAAVRAVAALLVLGMSGGGTYLYMEHIAGQDEPSGINDVSPQDARQQVALVHQEDLRIMQTRAVLESALLRGGAQAAQVREPHISSSANGATLVLPGRTRPYYVADLQRYGGERFQRQSDGSYLLGINVYVASGARLVLQSASGPLTIRMQSVPGAFTSIVGFGASIRLNGSAQNPVRIIGWDDRARRPDTRVADGRAYIREIGGELTVRHAEISNLGFWSGRTGGVALTGSDRPYGAADDIVPPAARPATAEQRRAAKRGTAAQASPSSPAAPAAGGRVVLPDGTTVAIAPGTDMVDVAPAKGGVPTRFVVPSANLVTGSVQDSTITGNAYGLFISGAEQAEVIGNRVRDSLIHGVFLHRFVKNATLENTTVTGSRGDGFVLSRATEKVRVVGCRSERNARNGFTVNGTPLAEGPSASGESTDAFGDTSVTSSVASGNGRYGIELLGGSKIAVQTSRIGGGDMGIVAGGDATGISITGNELTGQERQGIALRDGVTGAKVSGNIIARTRTALFVRAADAVITGNTVRAASTHGVSLLGEVAGTQVTGNTFGGAGHSAIDVDRARGTTTVRDNNTRGWEDVAGFWTTARRIAKPMNVIWASVFGLVVFMAVRSRHGGTRSRVGADPYAGQRPLARRPVRPLGRRTAAVPPLDAREPVPPGRSAR